MQSVDIRLHKMHFLPLPSCQIEGILKVVLCFIYLDQNSIGYAGDALEKVEWLRSAVRDAPLWQACDNINFVICTPCEMRSKS